MSKNPYTTNVTTPDNDLPSGGISWYLSKAVYIAFGGTVNIFGSMLSVVLNNLLENVGVDLTEDFTDVTDFLVNELVTDDAVPPAIRNFLGAILHKNGTFPMFLKYILAFIVLFLGFFGAKVPFMRTATQSANRVVQNELPDVPALMEMRTRGLIDDDTFKDILVRYGFDNSIRNGFDGIREDLLTPTELIVLLNRGHITQVEFRDMLNKRGYSDASVTQYILLSEYIPGPTDLVRFSVRDIYSDNIVSKYGYADELPPKFVEDAALQGIKPDMALNYWKAHWNVPSPRMAYDMLHRGIISEAEVADILKIADYPAYWRDKLIKLAYRPLTRVDVRRMYQDGVLDTTELLQAYKDLGYNDFNANKMTQWTINEFVIKTTELTKGQIFTAYRNGTFTRDEAGELLSSFGLSPYDIQIVLQAEDIKIQDKYEREYVKELKASFLTNVLGLGEVRNELTFLEMSEPIIENTLKLWELEKRRRVRKPTTKQLQDMFDRGIIGENDIRRILTESNYSVDSIENLLKLITGG